MWTESSRWFLVSTEKNLRQLVGNLGEQERVQFPLIQHPPHRPQCLPADVFDGIGLPGKVEGEVPLEIESQLLDRLVVGGVKHLLEDERPQGGVDLLGGSPEVFVERGSQFVDGQFREDLPAEKSRPGILQ